jgi:hypothetical protein
LLSLAVVGVPYMLVGVFSTPQMRDPAAAMLAGGSWTVFGPLIGVGLLYFVLSFVLYGALVYGTFRDLSGNPAGIGDLVRRGLVRALPILGVSILSAIGMMAGLMLFIVPGLILLCMWAVAVPVTVVEEPGVLASFGRSAELTKGYRWSVFGIGVIYYIGSMLVGLLLLGVTMAVAVVLPFVSAVLNGVVNAVTIAFGSVTLTVLYAELRRVKEGIGVGEIAQVFD